MNRHSILAVLLALLPLAATPAASSDAVPNRWYLGASYGISSLNHDVADFSDGSVGNAVVDSSDTGWKVVGGRRLNRHFSIEISYADFNNEVDDEPTFSGFSDGSGAEFPAGPVSIDLDEPTATTLSLVGTLPFTGRVGALLKVGAASWQVDRTTFHDAVRSTRSDSGVDVALGAGLQYLVGSRTEIRVEWERYAGISGDDIDLASVGVIIGIGRSRR